MSPAKPPSDYPPSDEVVVLSPAEAQAEISERRTRPIVDVIDDAIRERQARRGAPARFRGVHGDGNFAAKYATTPGQRYNPPTPMAAKPTPNKSAFVRSQPADAPAADVVAAAKKAGMTINAAFVYSIRSAAKTKAQKGEVKSKVSKVNAPTAAVTVRRVQGPGPAPAADSVVESLRLLVREEIKRYFAERE